MVVNFMDKGGLTMMYMFNDLLKIDPKAEEQKDKIKLIVAAILVIAIGVGGLTLTLSLML